MLIRCTWLHIVWVWISHILFTLLHPHFHKLLTRINTNNIPTHLNNLLTTLYNLKQTIILTIVWHSLLHITTCLTCPSTLTWLLQPSAQLLCQTSMAESLSTLAIVTIQPPSTLTHIEFNNPMHKLLVVLNFIVASKNVISLTKRWLTALEVSKIHSSRLKQP